MSFFKTIKAGVKYMDDWPQEALLNPVFPECRVKKAMLTARWLLPPFIVFILVWTYIQGGGFQGVELMFIVKTNYPVALVCALFLLLMPVQGYYWFGRRSQMRLNKKQEMFYVEISKQLQRTPANEPTMRDLEIIINDGIKALGKDFLRKL